MTVTADPDQNREVGLTPLQEYTVAPPRNRERYPASSKHGPCPVSSSDSLGAQCT